MHVIVVMDSVDLRHYIIMVLLLTCVPVVLCAAESSLYTPAVTDSYVLESPDSASSK